MRNAAAIRSRAVPREQPVFSAFELFFGSPRRLRSSRKSPCKSKSFSEQLAGEWSGRDARLLRVFARVGDSSRRIVDEASLKNRLERSRASSGAVSEAARISGRARCSREQTSGESLRAEVFRGCEHFLYNHPVRCRPASRVSLHCARDPLPFRGGSSASTAHARFRAIRFFHDALARHPSHPRVTTSPGNRWDRFL